MHKKQADIVHFDQTVKPASERRKRYRGQTSWNSTMVIPVAMALNSTVGSEQLGQTVMQS